MKKMTQYAAMVAVIFGLLTSRVDAQSFDVTGTRAAGMGGAFVGVADDASALYWNPAGLAAGSYFSLVLDASSRRAIPADRQQGSRQSSLFLGLTTPAFGVTYYRLHQSTAAPDSLLVPVGSAGSSRNITGAAGVRLNSLTTHHAGVTLVQSVVPGVAVGATLKMVRGFAASDLTASTTARSALDGDAVPADGNTRFDADLGIMANSSRLKGGLALRNLREPEFTSKDGTVLRLERQIRAGMSWAATGSWLVAADVDLLTSRDAFGERRDGALGVEGKVARRATVRSGLKVNLASTDDVAVDGSAKGFSVGGTFAVTPAVLLDGVAVTGGDRAGRGWGISARFVY
ncbi:MAG TPA: conjugal transfer protein TraF [Vicinamibacterales bacterium]|nr:conjugal transfer protein TraF [Vicinamibacterales bacterium]